MALGGNHVRLGSSTWCTPQTRQKLAAFKKFHFDFGHNKPRGLSMPLFPLNPQRAVHKAKCLSHKTPSLRSARPGLHLNLWTEHSLLSNNYSLKCLNWSKPPEGRHRTLCFLSLSQNTGFVYGRWLVITCWFAWVRTCINKACATVQSSMAQIILVRAKTPNILHLNGSLKQTREVRAKDREPPWKEFLLAGK